MPRYEQTWLILLSLFFCFPIGLVLVWRKPTWQRALKIGITVAVGLLFVGTGIASALSGNNNSSNDANSGAIVATTSTNVEIPTTRAHPKTVVPRTTLVPRTTIVPRTTPPTPPPTPATTAVTTPAPPPAPLPTPPPPSNVQQGVHPGSFCSPLGAPGATVDGTAMVCSDHSATGKPYTQPRWRSA